MRMTKDSFPVGARVEVISGPGSYLGTVVNCPTHARDYGLERLWILPDDTPEVREWYGCVQPMHGWNNAQVTLIELPAKTVYYVRAGDATPFKSTDKSEAIGYAKALKAMGVLVRVETEETITKEIWS